MLVNGTPIGLPLLRGRGDVGEDCALAIDRLCGGWSLRIVVEPCGRDRDLHGVFSLDIGAVVCRGAVGEPLATLGRRDAAAAVAGLAHRLQREMEAAATGRAARDRATARSGRLTWEQLSAGRSPARIGSGSGRLPFHSAGSFAAPENVFPFLPSALRPSRDASRGRVSSPSACNHCCIWKPNGNRFYMSLLNLE